MLGKERQGTYDELSCLRRSSSVQYLLMHYKRMPIEIESPEEMGYGSIRCNLAESSLRDRTLGELNLECEINLNDLVLQYGDHRGHPQLRAILAEQGQCDPNGVLLTVGAAGALFIISTTLLNPGDHLIVLRPNYATNIETPRAIGCEISYLDLSFERGWRYTAADIKALLRPNTRLISLTTPHNPTGVVLPLDELGAIAALAEAQGCYLLVDETYKDLTIVAAGAAPSPTPYASAISDRIISVSSLSKAYGLPGLRMGWLLTRDTDLALRFLAAKEQIHIGGAIIEEEIAWQVLRQRAAWLPRIQAEVRRGLDIMQAWMAQQVHLEWVQPQGGVVCFPRIKPDAPIDVERFYRTLNASGTFVGPGHWFEQDRRYMRIGFGWPTPNELEEGLENVTAALADSVNLS